MRNYEQQYKKKSASFTDANGGRLVRSIRHEEQRRLNRAENYARHRDVPEVTETEETASTSSDLEVKLQRWKAERDIRKKIESQKKKPVFKIGIVHHKFYSPINDKTNVKPTPCHGRGVRKEKHHRTPPKRITRATEKRLEAKLAGTAVIPGIASTSGLQLTRTRSTKNPKFPTSKNASVSFAPENHVFKAPTGLNELPLFGKFVIPKRTETDESSSESKIDFNSEDEKEKPWPHANHPTVDVMDSQKIVNSLVRRNTLRFSTDSIDPKNHTNSSIEAVNLRLSSEDKTPEETDESERTDSNNFAAQLDFSAVADKIDTEGTRKEHAPESDENVEEIDKPETDEFPQMAEVITIGSSLGSESSAPKTTQKVDSSDDVFLDKILVGNVIREDMQNSLDLNRANSGIDSCNDEEDDSNYVETNFMKNVTIRKVEKRLDFEDEFFIETENTDTGEGTVAVIPENPAVYDASIPEPPVIPVITVTKPGRSSKILETSIEEGEEKEEDTSFVVSPKNLRNRTIPATIITPWKRIQKSTKSPAIDKSLHDMSIKENCDPLGDRKEGMLEDVEEKGTSEEHSKRRRSSSKSIKLDRDECNTCTPQSNLSKSVGAQIIGDLITFDSPINNPMGTRRLSFR